MFLIPRILTHGIMAALCLVAGGVTAAEEKLRVAVLENSPPMSYRDTDGRLTGFSAEIIRAVCAEMQARCELQPILLERVVNALVSGEIDIAAVSLLDTACARVASSSRTLHCLHKMRTRRWANTPSKVALIR